MKLFLKSSWKRFAGMVLIAVLFNQCIYGIVRIGPVESKKTPPYEVVKGEKDKLKEIEYSKKSIEYILGEGKYSRELACEVLTYSDGLSWNVFMIVIGWIPLPFLAFPTGRIYKRFYLRDGSLIAKVESHYDGTHIYGYMISDVKYGFTFGADSHALSPESDLDYFITTKCQLAR
ncbi:hypothetical protein CH371_18595 [Leptospira wolffii]|uniref:Uncharacterized protein n=1 Tax=Leptospira wolffii TaxID=409998 RepID=A0A2M9Z7R0_9LEPT|nr:hypothetical protein [Leptospira wolffii]PJZ64424.1 hypothetical protein CH371_18595 [Leptospira wolffii]